MKKTIRCIKCPIGCEVTAEYNEEELLETEGAICPRGKKYVKKEIFAPERILTSSVKVNNGELPLVSVRTDGEIPKEYIFDIMDLINEKIIEAPIDIGETIIHHPLELDVDIIATKTVDRKN